MGEKFDKGFRKFGVSVLALISKIKFGTVKHIEDAPEKGALILCNHTSIWDFSYLIYAMFPRTDMRFLVTAVHYDRSKFVHWLFKHLGLIRKNQGATDLQCVKDMLNASRKGDVVVIYSAGMTSFDGRQAWNALPGTGAMPKLLKKDVYIAKANGGFISYPRYAHKTYRGRVEMEIKLLYSAEQVKSMNADELQSGINQALKFNDWDWQQQNHVRFRHMKNMKNVSRTLYMCPKCLSEGKLIEKRGRLECSECGLIAKRDGYGFFLSDWDKLPARMDKWVDMELESLKTQLADDNFELCEEAAYYTRPQNSVDKHTFVSQGKLHMNKTELRFEGENGNLRLGFDEFQFIILSDTNALIINTDKLNHRFEFKDTRLMTKWFFAHRLISGFEANK